MCYYSLQINSDAILIIKKKIIFSIKMLFGQILGNKLYFDQIVGEQMSVY